MFYLGRGRGGPVHLDGESHLLVLGPPRCGKTTALVVPNLLASQQATVVTSTKVDIMASTAKERSRHGRVWVFDPSGSTPVPGWATPLRFSPVGEAVDFKRAMLLARAMVRSSTVHAGHALSFWEERAEAVLAPCLLAARLGGLGMPEVMEMVEGRELESAVAMLAAKGEREAASALSAVVASSERERSGVLSTAAGLLSAYRMPEVLADSASPNFDATAFAASTDTLYVVAPSTVQDLLSPVVAGLIAGVKQAAYAQANARVAGGGSARPVPAVKLLLDEMANIAPLHDLGGILSEGASQGVLVLGVLQDLSQARYRWPGLSDGMLTLFQNTLVFPGIANLPELVRYYARPGGGAMPFHPRRTPLCLVRTLDRWGITPLISAFVLIQTEVGSISEVAQNLRGTPGVDFADEVTGPYDIVCRVHADDLISLGDSVTAAIQRIEGVTRTLTCPVTRNISLADL